MDIENIINFSKDQTNTEMFMQIYFKINTYVGKVVAEKACVISKEKIFPTRCSSSVSTDT